MIDLHSHSYFSDGTESPEHVVRLAGMAGVEMLALTDHDTLDGMAEFLAAAKKYPGMVAVPGIELSKNDVIEILALGIKNGRAFSKDYKDSPEDIVGLARAMGGIPVLAHPVHIKRRGVDLGRLVARLKGCGLMGIECFHPDHSDAMARECLDLAERFGLLATAGSDFHGTTEPGRLFGYYGEGDWRNCRALSRTRKFVKDWAGDARG